MKPIVFNHNIMIDSIKAEFGITELVIEADSQEIEAQTALGGKISFEEALKLAIALFLENGEDVESPFAIIENCPEDCGLSSNPPTEAITEKVREYMNSPKSQLTLLRLDETPENCESVEFNWIFLLRLRQLSDHLHWAIIDRAGVKPPYNYGFN